jgi:hypothetical protein
VTESGDSKLREFEKRSHEALEAGAEGLGADVRSRLTQARFKALAEIEKPSQPKWFRVLAPAGGMAAAALVAVIAWRGVTGGSELVPVESARGDVLEVVAMADDYDLLEDDVEFYQWLDTEPELSGSDLPGVG